MNHQPAQNFRKKLSNQPRQLNMPYAKGKANYKVHTLIQVLKEMLLNGAQGWQEAAALYPHQSGEPVLRDHDDMKHHWVKKCSPGHPNRDRILRCQRIHQKILPRTSSLVMGIDSGGDEGLSWMMKRKLEQRQRRRLQALFLGAIPELVCLMVWAKVVLG